jgi:hypothetical protein
VEVRQDVAGAATDINANVNAVGKGRHGRHGARRDARSLPEDLRARRHSSAQGRDAGTQVGRWSRARLGRLDERARRPASASLERPTVPDQSVGDDPGGWLLRRDIVAIDTGSKTRLEAGEVLEYLAPPLNIETQVVLQLALDEDGADAESDGAARNRLLAALSQPTAGGNAGRLRRVGARAARDRGGLLLPEPRRHRHRRRRRTALGHAARRAS